MKKQVIIYTKNRCPECEKIKFNLGYLPQEVKDSHDFLYLNIDEDMDAHAELLRYGYQSVPVTFVEGHKPIVGFEFGQIQEALGL